jgi:hypothetical protein
VSLFCLYAIENRDDRKTLGRFVRVLAFFAAQPGLDIRTIEAAGQLRTLLVDAFGEAGLAGAAGQAE